MPVLVEAKRAAKAQGCAFYFDVCVDGRQGLGREVVREGLCRHRLPAPLEEGRGQAGRRGVRRADGRLSRIWQLARSNTAKLPASPATLIAVAFVERPSAVSSAATASARKASRRRCRARLPSPRRCSGSAAITRARARARGRARGRLSLERAEGRARSTGSTAGLAAAERGDPNSRALWLFFGDSHTAGDSMTRRRLRGDLAAALRRRRPRPGRRRQAHRASLLPARRPLRPRRGLEGVGSAARMATPSRAGSRASGCPAKARVHGCGSRPAPSARPAPASASSRSCTTRRPITACLRYRVDDGAWRSRCRPRPAPVEPACTRRARSCPVPDGSHKLTLEHGGGGTIDLFGVVMERARPGVVVDSLGVVGRRLGSLRSWDWSIIGDQLATRDPQLVVLHAVRHQLRPTIRISCSTISRATTTRRSLRIRARRPCRLASIVILGPPDMGVREAGKSCDATKKKSPDAPEIPECVWKTPSILAEIISTEHCARRCANPRRVLRHVRRDGRRRSGWARGRRRIRRSRTRRSRPLHGPRLPALGRRAVGRADDRLRRMAHGAKPAAEQAGGAVVAAAAGERCR